MALSKKHYERVAYNVQLQIHSINGHGESVGDNTKAYARAKLLSLAQNLADDFSNDNPRFDRQRFLKACGF